ncbi:MAG: glycosyltransferase family A protein [Christiangramia sp.]|uniref:glycosyltransferase family 2 protein n=1 Tax=Christiangramia sp. TaxID=1931228 RepID=UPI003242589F
MLTKQKKISVIIACYNDKNYLEQSIDSALNQSYPNKEIIVVDDGSNEDTKKFLRSIESKIDILISQENLGPGSARNKGVDAATGEYILILDSDDYFEPEFCKMAAEILDHDENVKIVTCHARWFTNEKKFQIYKPKGGTVENFLVSNSAVGNSLMRKKDFLSCGGYDEDLKSGFEDWELFIRLLAKGGNAHVIPQILFHYRKRKHSRSAKAIEKKYELQEYIYNKHSNIYKEHFSVFIHDWFKNVKKSEKFKKQVMESIDYKVGYNILRPFRKLGLFKKIKK